MILYEPRYTGSKALLVGIDKYQTVAPLSHAVNDARGLKKALIDDFGFQGDDVSLLLDEDATKEHIMRAFLQFADGGSAPNDRIVFFFAGHGHTRSGNRQEVGFLVPVDGDINDLASLIRWDELTRNAELIPAKHILFIMDACYGGLALTRSLSAGSMRFLKDMVQRFSRQVIAAGKADETVADVGGPLPDHSVFTGHLLEGMAGNAKTQEGVLTASGLMAYVYEHVSKDPHSRQTPHYGFLEGDGDFIFTDLPTTGEGESAIDKDVLVALPSSNPGTDTPLGDISSLVDKTKEFLSEQRYVIRLHDLLVGELRRFLASSANDFFAVGSHWSPDDFQSRVKRYEAISERLLRIATCVSYWGQSEHQAILEKIVRRTTDRLVSQGGLVVWIALRWYPVLLLAYSSGIASISAGKYDHLRALFDVQVRPFKPQVARSALSPLVLELADALGEGDANAAFKQMPGHERHYAPRSEYLFKYLQPIMDDLLFLGEDYEFYFDRYEVFFALVCADASMNVFGIAWGPPGRFAYKLRGRLAGGDPFSQVVKEAESQQDKWPPLRAGLFGGSYARFAKVAAAYGEQITNLHWS